MKHTWKRSRQATRPALCLLAVAVAVFSFGFVASASTPIPRLQSPASPSANNASGEEGAREVLVDSLKEEKFAPIKWLPRKWGRGLVELRFGYNVPKWPELIEAYEIETGKRTEDDSGDEEEDDSSEEDDTKEGNDSAEEGAEGEEDWPKDVRYDLNTPGRHLVVSFEKERPAAILIQKFIVDGSSVPLDRDMLAGNPINWRSTGLPRKYDTTKLEETLQYYLHGEGANKDTKIIFQYRDMSYSRNTERITKSIKDMKILRFPQTWQNIWEREVGKAPLDERLSVLKEFDEAFQSRLKNRDFKDEWCSKAEQSAYAEFYYQQHARKRDQNPRDPEIYRQLSEYYESRERYDAKLSVMLDAVRNEIPEDERLRFHYEVGRDLVKRMRLYQDAIPHLHEASVIANAELLLVECYHQLGRYAEALDTIEKLVKRIEEGFNPFDEEEGSGNSGSPTEGDAPGDDTPKILKAKANPMGIIFLMDEEGNEIEPRETLKQRALLFQARAQIQQGQLRSADTTLKRVNTLAAESTQAVTAETEEAAVLLMGMLLYVGGYKDVQAAFNTVPRFKQLWANAARQRAKEGEAEDIPYDPIGSKALTLNVQAMVVQSTGGRFSGGIGRVLEYAALLDPLSPDAWKVRGMAEERNQRDPERYANAMDSYQMGLTIKPDDPQLHYMVGVLYQRAGQIDRARESFEMVLRYKPKFFAAMNRLGEIQLILEQEARDNLTQTFIGASEITDEVRAEAQRHQEAANQALLAAARYYSSSLELQPRQPVLKTALASLYIRVSENIARSKSIRSQALAKSYMRKARALAGEVMSECEAYGAAGTSQDNTDQFAKGRVPPVLCFAIYAQASYELGKPTTGSGDQGNVGLQEESLRALKRLREIGENPDFFSDDRALQAFQSSADWGKALDMLNRIEANLRQRRLVEHFARQGPSASSENMRDLGGGWGLVKGEYDERCFVKRVKGGTLTMELDKVPQNNDNQVFRISRQEDFDKLAMMEASLVRRGRESIKRGIHMTKVTVPEKGEGIESQWSLVLAFDERDQLYWDIYRYEPGGSKNDPKQYSMLSEGAVYIDPSLYGAGSLTEKSRVNLRLTRFVSADSEDGLIEFYADVNGYRIRIVPRDYMDTEEARDIDAVAELDDGDAFAMRMGIFVQGKAGSSGSIEVSKIEWVIDPNLAGKKD